MNIRCGGPHKLRNFQTLHAPSVTESVAQKRQLLPLTCMRPLAGLTIEGTSPVVLENGRFNGSHCDIHMICTGAVAGAGFISEVLETECTTCVVVQ